VPYTWDTTNSSAALCTAKDAGVLVVGVVAVRVVAGVADGELDADQSPIPAGADLATRFGRVGDLGGGHRDPHLVAVGPAACW
jgi:hypothetical protein